MQLFAFLPLIIVGLVVLTSVRAAEQKKRQEAQRRSFEQQQQQRTRPVVPPVQTQQPRPAVRPVVQTTPARQAPVPGSYAVPVRQKPAAKAPAPQKMHPQHDMCALEPEPSETPAAHAADRQSGESILSFTPNNILQGVLFAEVFGKPKALR